MEKLGGSEEAKHSAVLFHYSNKDVRMALHGDDFACLSDEDGLSHINPLLESEYTAKGMGTPGFQDSDAKRLPVVEPCVSCRDRSKWTVLED